MFQNFFLLEMILCVNIINCNFEEYTQEQEDYDMLESFSDYESSEHFNVSLKNKPTRITVQIHRNEDKINETQENLTYKYNNCNKQQDENNEDSVETQRCRNTLVNYPYSVSIQRKGTHYATGALVHKRWILTVAAEFYNVRESIKLYRARLGSVDCKKGGTLVPLKYVEVHPLYVYGKPAFDLSLLRTALVVNYSDFIKPISISIRKEKVLSAQFLTTYWPRLIIKGQLIPKSAKERLKHNSMRVSKQRLIPWDICYQQVNVTGIELDKSCLCLKPIVMHHTICMPDVGSPIVAEDGLWGVTSGWVSEECQLYPSPILFARLSLTKVRSWLDSQLLIA